MYQLDFYFELTKCSYVRVYDLTVNIFFLSLLDISHRLPIFDWPVFVICVCGFVLFFNGKF